MFGKIRKYYKQSDKETFFIYVILRLAIVISAILQLMYKNYANFFLCLITLILFALPYFVSKKFKIELPSGLEIIIFIFIFCGIILGEIQNFFSLFKNWDTLLHGTTGFVSAAIGFSLVDILNKTDKFYINMNSFFVVLVAVTFSMTVGVVWEFFEYGADQILSVDMQKDILVDHFSSTYFDKTLSNQSILVKNIEKTIIISKDGDREVETVIDDGYLDVGLHDTMGDMFVNFVGCMLFTVICTLYMGGKDKYKLAEKFIPRVKTN